LFPLCGSESKTAEKLMWVSSWSPDENSLALQVPIEGKRVGEKNFQQLETIDLQSLKSFAVPSSQGIHRAFWVASDTLTGATEDWKKLVLSISALERRPSWSQV